MTKQRSPKFNLNIVLAFIVCSIGSIGSIVYAKEKHKDPRAKVADSADASIPALDQLRREYLVKVTDASHAAVQTTEREMSGEKIKSLAAYVPEAGELIRVKGQPGDDGTYQLPNYDYLPIGPGTGPGSADRQSHDVQMSLVGAKVKPVKLSSGPIKGYLDADDKAYVSTFEKPGQSQGECGRYEQECVIWPNNNTEIEILDSKIAETKDPSSGAIVLQNFYQIKYQYQELQGSKVRYGIGWIPADLVSTTPIKVGASKPASKSGKNKDCPEKVEAAPLGKAMDLGGLVNEPANRLAKQSIIDVIAPRVGKCVLTPAKKSDGNGEAGKLGLPKFSPKDSPYDLLVAPTWAKASGIRIEGGKEITPKQLQAIDAYARTAYGEMANCWSPGSQYLKAVIAVAVNRTEAAEKSQGARTTFWKEQEASNNPPDVKTIAASKQFSVYNPRDRDGVSANGNLKQVLCPPSDPSKKFWANQLPGKLETQIWRSAVEIATQAILSRSVFRQETKAITQKYYTSGLGKFYDLKKVTPAPAIGGKRLARSKCIELWE
jgi:hypothetical protein